MKLNCTKTILLIILLLTTKLCFSQTGWISQVSGTTENLRSIFFINDLTGWTVGYSGKILKTTNAGTNWITQTSPTVNPLLSVYFANPLSGWAVGGEGDIIVTGNGGLTWSLQSTGSTSALNSVYFVSASTGWAAGEFMTILKTTNSGTNWIPLLSGEVPLNSVIFNSTSIGYIAGNNGYVMKTTNGGLSWSVQNSNTSYNLFSIHFPPGTVSIAYAVGMGTPSPPILKSSDSGMTWSIQTVPLGNALNSVYFSGILSGWSAGFLGTIKHTTNGGISWTDQISGTTNILRSIYFVNSLTGWAVGDFGIVLKTGNGGLTDFKINSEILPDKYSLEQNYPNPFNPTTNIKFELKDTKLVTLKVYDITGKLVETLVNQKLQAGEYNVDFDGRNLSSGLYIYRIEAGEFKDSKKMLMIK